MSATADAIVHRVNVLCRVRGIPFTDGAELVDSLVRAEIQREIARMETVLAAEARRGLPHLTGPGSFGARAAELRAALEAS